ncbi:MAG: hypothetical protein P0Y66_06720 [Candidatus Kaistia colombiensis]|nr:MAG: hypothetical protein P0Y66_06720 [Kaistia sp.]
MQAHAISGPWAAGDRVLVCIDDRPRGARLVRYARGRPTGCARPGRRLHVETPRRRPCREPQGPHRRDLRLREQLGGEAVTLPGQDVAREIVAMRTPTTSPTSSSASRQAALARVLEGSVSHDLIRHAGDISVHVISGAERSRPPARRRLASAARLRAGPISALALCRRVALGFALLARCWTCAIWRWSS